MQQKSYSESPTIYNSASLQDCEDLLRFNMEGRKMSSYEDVIEDIGFGTFHVLLTLGAGFLWAADSMEMMINSILSPILKCDWKLSSFQESTISTVAFMGQAIGAVGWGYLSDSYGRKITLCASAALVFLFGVASSQAPSYWFMLVCRCLIGLGVGGIPQTVVILTEIVPTQQRSKAVLSMAIFWGVGPVFASALAMVIINALNWRYYLLILSTPLVIFLIGSWWIPESPRYLLITNQIDKLNASMQRIARMNMKDIGEIDKLDVVVSTRGRILDLFSEKLKATTFLLSVIWFTVSFCYFGVGLLTTQMFQSGIDGCHTNKHENLSSISEGCRKLTNSDYKDLMITSTAEIPALLIISLVIDKIGRKICLVIQFGVALASVLSLLICSSRNVMVVLIFVFRGALSSLFQTIFLYTAEVYPTNVRSVGLGCCSMIARFGSMITPLVAQVLIYKSFYLAIGVYAFPMLLSIISSLLLKKETSQAPLEDYSGEDSQTASILTDGGNYQTFE